MVTSQRTGERIVAEYHQTDREDYLEYLLHLSTYRFASTYTQGKHVLDYGCGSGYGTALLARHCSSIIGVDISAEGIDYAKSHYQLPNGSYQCIKKAEQEALPFADHSFEVVLSFQVLEHLEHEAPYLQEVRRVLKPGGQMILATPDRTTRLFPFQKPWNGWHIREYSPTQLQRLLAPYFSELNILYLGGQQEVIQIEMQRTRKLRLLLLPFTLPVIPENIRIRCLRFLMKIKHAPARQASTTRRPGFDESALSISDDAANSVTLIAIGKIHSYIAEKQ